MSKTTEWLYRIFEETKKRRQGLMAKSLIAQFDFRDLINLINLVNPINF